MPPRTSPAEAAPAVPPAANAAGPAARPAAPEAGAGRIGPNAITRVIEALDAGPHTVQLDELLAEAGLSHYLGCPPETMVDEREVVALHRALRRRVGAAAFAEITRDAGLRTGRYLLAHRIPKPVQFLLERLPARLAARVLLAAIGQHAWTFAGSGTFSWRLVARGAPGPRVVLAIAQCPLARAHRTETPACDFYAGTFERLFRTLVHRDAVVTETRCEAAGAGPCTFEVRW